jgi:hypothetical protein
MVYLTRKIQALFKLCLLVMLVTGSALTPPN